MNLLLTSAGISNPSIEDALVGLLGKPIAESSALIIPTIIPMATALFATLIHEPLTPRKLLGFAVASAGAAIVIVAGQQGEGGSSSAANRLGTQARWYRRRLPLAVRLEEAGHRLDSSKQQDQREGGKR